MALLHAFGRIYGDAYPAASVRFMRGALGPRRVRGIWLGDCRPRWRARSSRTARVRPLRLPRPSRRITPIEVQIIGRQMAAAHFGPCGMGSTRAAVRVREYPAWR